MYVSLIFAFTFSFLAVILLCPLSRSLALRLNILDSPDHRKIHEMPIPRIGGVSVFFAIVFGLICATWLAGNLAIYFQRKELWYALLTGGTAIFMLGLWDDIRAVPSLIKLMIQIAIAGLTVGVGVKFDYISFLGSSPLYLGLFAVPFSVLWIVIITNAFNLIDGLDGLAAGLASIAAGTSVVVFLMRGLHIEAMFLLCVLGALLGFLFYNFYPARVFLGDAGSLFVGYCLAVTAITGSQKGITALSILFPLLAFGIPLTDIFITAIRRFVVNHLSFDCGHQAACKRLLTRTRSIFVPDRNHIHHRLLARGLSHREAVLILYGCAMLLSGFGLLIVFSHGRNEAIIVLLVALAASIGVSQLKYDEFRALNSSKLLNLCEYDGNCKDIFKGFVDLVVIGCAFWGAILVKYESLWPEDEWFRNLFVIALAGQFCMFWAFGFYRSSWRTLTDIDILKIAGAVICGILLSASIGLISIPPQGYIGFWIIDAFLLFIGLLMVRGAYRMLQIFAHDTRVGKPALIYGADKEAQIVSRQLLQKKELGLIPIGFIDDNPYSHGKFIGGYKVFGASNSITTLVKRWPNLVVVITSPHKDSSSDYEELCAHCSKLGIPLFLASFSISPFSFQEDDVHLTSDVSIKEHPSTEQRDSIAHAR